MLPAILAVWTSLPFLVLGAGGLTVDSPSQDALCPPLEQTRSIVESRLGAVELEGTWRATYLLVHRAEGDRVTLRLHDPAGAVRLEREFSAEGGTCATLAQVIALVLERYFLRPETTVDSSPLTSMQAELPPAPAVQAPAPRSGLARASMRGSTPIVPAAPIVTEPRPTTPHPTRRMHYTFDAALWATTAWLAPSLGVGLRSSEQWSVGLTFGYDLSEHESRIASGMGKSKRLPFSLDARRQLLRLEPLRLDLGAELLGLHERVQTAGLFQNGTGSRLVPGIGLRLGAELRLGRSNLATFIDASGAMLLRWLTNPFEVDHEPAFVPPTFVVGLHLGIRTIL